MFIAVISDIHGNRQALEAVLGDIAGYMPDHIVNLGDVVGYGGDPEWCLQTIKYTASISILGNHDVNAADMEPIHPSVNPVAALALHWTSQHLSDDSKSFLRGLQYQAQEPCGRIGYVHSSVPHPESFHYLLRRERIEEHLQEQTQKITFVGHSHLPDCWSTDGTKMFCLFGYRSGFVSFDLNGPEQDKSMVNTGSVGQPRDHDPKASYALLEIEGSKLKIMNKKVEYDIETAQARIREAGLPEALATRIEFGR